MNRSTRKKDLIYTIIKLNNVMAPVKGGPHTYYPYFQTYNVCVSEVEVKTLEIFSTLLRKCVPGLFCEQSTRL